MISGIEGYRQHFFRLTTAFPDAHITIDHIFGLNNQVAARYTVEATHTGDFGGIPPAGRRVRVTAIAIAKVTGGKIVVEHAHSDALGLLTQLGVIEAPHGSRTAALTHHLRIGLTRSGGCSARSRDPTKATNTNTRDRSLPQLSAVRPYPIDGGRDTTLVFGKGPRLARPRRIPPPQHRGRPRRPGRVA